jgi:hypothetical protein
MSQYSVVVTVLAWLDELVGVPVGAVIVHAPAREACITTVAKSAVAATIFLSCVSIRKNKKWLEGCIYSIEY